jgi:hypothetical protein
MSPREAHLNRLARQEARDARLLRKETRRALRRAQKNQSKENPDDRLHAQAR